MRNDDQHPQSDDDLRTRFRKLADEVAAGAPPSPEWIAAQYGPAFRGRGRAHRSTLGRLVAVSASLAGVVIALLVGMVLGANTGYASARGIPMKSALAITCGALALAAPSTPGGATAGPLAKVPPPRTVPVVDLAAATVRSQASYGAITGVHELPDGQILVNDGVRKQVKLLDRMLGVTAIVLDSVRGASNWYGGVKGPLIPYLGDSTLFPDQRAGTVSVLDPHGVIVRSLSMPSSREMGSLRRGAVDNTGRLIFAGQPAITRPQGNGFAPIAADSAPLLRADFVLHRTDTIAYIARPLTRADAMQPNGSLMAYWNPDPLRTVDEWAVLTDGSVAVVRGWDYHIDWIRPDGTRAPTPTLPFDSRHLTDADKAKMIDSALALRATSARNNTLVSNVEMVAPWLDKHVGAIAPTSTPPTPDTTGGLHSNNNGGIKLVVLAVERPSPDQVFDQYPAFQSGSVLADLDDHLWILPTTAKQSRAGEPVYDIIDTHGELVKRVRVPVGRFVVGFGRGGVVYLESGDPIIGFSIERAALPASSAGR